jgi:hypothetical protein
MLNKFVFLGVLMISAQVCQSTQVLALNVPTCKEPETHKGENIKRLSNFIDENKELFGKIMKHTVTEEEAKRGLLTMTVTEEEAKAGLSRVKNYQPSKDEIKHFQSHINGVFKNDFKKKLHEFQDNVAKNNFGTEGAESACMSTAEGIRQVIEVYTNITSKK